MSHKSQWHRQFVEFLGNQLQTCSSLTNKFQSKTQFDSIQSQGKSAIRIYHEKKRMFQSIEQGILKFHGSLFEKEVLKILNKQLQLEYPVVVNQILEISDVHLEDYKMDLMEKMQDYMPSELREKYGNQYRQFYNGWVKRSKWEIQIDLIFSQSSSSMTEIISNLEKMKNDNYLAHWSKQEYLGVREEQTKKKQPFRIVCEFKKNFFGINAAHPEINMSKTAENIIQLERIILGTRLGINQTVKNEKPAKVIINRKKKIRVDKQSNIQLILFIDKNISEEEFQKKFQPYKSCVNKFFKNHNATLHILCLQSCFNKMEKQLKDLQLKQKQMLEQMNKDKKQLKDLQLKQKQMLEQMNKYKKQLKDLQLKQKQMLEQMNKDKKQLKDLQLKQKQMLEQMNKDKKMLEEIGHFKNKDKIMLEKIEHLKNEEKKILEEIEHFKNVAIFATILVAKIALLKKIIG